MHTTVCQFTLFCCNNLHAIFVFVNDLILFYRPVSTLTIVAAGQNNQSESWMFEMDKINQKQKGYQIV